MTLTQTMLWVVDLCSLVYHRQNLDQKKNNQNMVNFTAIRYKGREHMRSTYDFAFLNPQKFSTIHTDSQHAGQRLYIFHENREISILTINKKQQG
jgi:hypothetical protein